MLYRTRLKPETFEVLLKFGKLNKTIKNNVIMLCTHFDDEYLSLSTIEANSSQQNQLDLFDMMVTNQLVTMGVNSDPEYVTYENEREISHNGNPIEWWCQNQNKYPKIS